MMQLYKTKSVEYENNRKKEQKEVEKQMERDLKDLKLLVREAEEEQ